jgi:hypothetical protein
MASYAFSLPTEPALRAIAEVSPRGVVEIGAGTGYWARLLHDRGVDVVAFDVAPPPSPDNPWFAGVLPWYPVRVGDESAVDRHARRTLLLVWPTRKEDWSAAAADRFATAGGERLAFVGEPIGGRTGDDRLHALLGELDRCWSCAYGIQTSACVCGVRPSWRRTGTVPLPDSGDDELRLYGRDDSAPPLAPAPTRVARAPWLRRLGQRVRRPASRPGPTAPFPFLQDALRTCSVRSTP